MAKSTDRPARLRRPRSHGGALPLATALTGAIVGLAHSARAQLVPRAENGVDAPGLVAAPTHGSEPSIASDGSSFLVGFSSEDHPAVALLAADGSSPAVFSSGLDRQADDDDLVIAYDGTRYLAVWTVSAPGAAAVRMARIGVDGRPLDAAPIVVAQSNIDGFHCVTVASGGSSSLVAWEQTSPSGASPGLVARSIGADGLPSTAAPTRFDARLGGCASLTYGGGQYLATRSMGDPSPGPVTGQRLDSSGTPIDATPFPIGVGSRSALATSAAYSSGQYLVGWQVDLPVDADTVHQAPAVARVRTDGTVADATPRALGGASWAPHVAARADGWLVNWWQGVGYIARIDATGGLLDPAPITLPAQDSDDSAIGWNGANNLIAWSSADGGLTAQRVSPLGTLLDPTPRQVGYSATDETGLALARSATGVLAAFIEADSAATPAIRVAMLAADGTPTSSPTHVLAMPDATLSSPLVASDGSGYLVCWIESTGGASDGVGTSTIRALRVGPDGTALDGTPLTLASEMTGRIPGTVTPTSYGFGLSSLLFDGAAYVLLATASSQDSNGGVIPLRITRDGVVGPESIGPTPISMTPFPNPREMAAASNGHGSLIAFGVGYVWGDSNAVGFVLTDGDGSTGSRPITQLAQTPDVRDVTVATSQGDYLIAWASQSQPGLHLARVTAGGVVLDDGTTAVLTDGTRFGIHAVGTADGYLLTWWSAAGILASRVTSAGQILDPGGVLVSDTIDSYSSPTLLAPQGTDPDVLMGYVRFDPTVIARRAFVRALGAVIPRDTGAPDSGLPADGSTAPTSHADGCGCRVAGRAGAGTSHRGLAAGLAGSIVVVLRRRRRRA